MRDCGEGLKSESGCDAKRGRKEVGAALGNAERAATWINERRKAIVVGLSEELKS